MTTIAERNRKIKKVLSAEFGAGKVTVRGSTGTAYGWVTVKINVRPTHSEQRDVFRARVWELFAQNNIVIGSYDSGDYGSGRTIHLEFGKPLDEFDAGERVSWPSGGKTGTVVEQNYRAGPGWYLVAWDDDQPAAKPQEFYKRDLQRVDQVTA